MYIQQNSTNRVNFIGDVHLVSCFPLASINVSKQVNINRLANFIDMRTQFTSKNVCASRHVSETFLPKWRLRELPTATGFSVI
jgi:hypothetical protein